MYKKKLFHIAQNELIATQNVKTFFLKPLQRTAKTFEREIILRYTSECIFYACVQIYGFCPYGLKHPVWKFRIQFPLTLE